MTDLSGVTYIKQVDLPAIINEVDIDAFIRILDRRASGSIKAIGAANKIKEKIGENSALKHIQRRFPGSKPIAVVRRTNGVPVLDLLLETPDGKFVIVEAKYSSSGKLRLGKTNGKVFVITNQGPVPIKVKGGTGQMSPQWIRNRYKEIQRIGKHNIEIRQLGKRLQVALHQGRFHALSVVTDSTGEVLLERDHTNEWLRSFTSEGTEFRAPSTFSSSVSPIVTKLPKNSPPSVGGRSTEGVARGLSPRTSSPPTHFPNSNPLFPDMESPNIKPTHIAKGLKRIGRGLIFDYVFDYAIGKTIEALEAELDRVKQELISSQWARFVYPNIERDIEIIISLEKSDADKITYHQAYIKLDWEVLLRRQGSDESFVFTFDPDEITGDIAWIYKNVYGEHGPVTVFEGVKYIQHDIAAYESQPRMRPKAKADKSDNKLLHEPHRDFILVWDKEVHRIAQMYREFAQKSMDQLNRIHDEVIAGFKHFTSQKEAKIKFFWITEHERKIESALQVYNFKVAKKLTNSLTHVVGGQFTNKVRDPVKNRTFEKISELEVIMAETSNKLFALSKKHQPNQRDLLSLFLEQEFDNLR